MRPYVVKQGDYLTRLAHDLGYQSGHIWGHARNDELRARREHPNTLAPGDLLRVPELRRLEHAIEPGAMNRYLGRRPRVPVHLVLVHDTEPLANARCVIEGLGPAGLEGRTDGEGRLSLDVPLHVRELRLTFPETELVFSVLVGQMDPITEPSGVRKRLANLGYLLALDDDDVDAGWDDSRLGDALRAFQQERHLEATGTMDDATRDALLKGYGG